MRLTLTAIAVLLLGVSAGVADEPRVQLHETLDRAVIARPLGGHQG